MWMTGVALAACWLVLLLVDLPAGGLAGIVKQEGFGGLYRGLTPTLMALLPNWAVSLQLRGGGGS